MKDEKLEEMKHDYNNIPIPENLAARVNDSIQAAKEELASNPPSPKKAVRFRRYFSRAAGVAAAAMLVITIMTNSGESIAYAMEGIPFIGAIARVVTFREYSHSGNNMEANIKVPSVSVENTDGTPLDAATEELNRKIEEYTSQIIAAYEADLAVNGEEGHESVNLDYEVITDNDKLFTLRFDQSIVMAGSMHSVMIYNLDKTTGQLITLKDLFHEGSDYVTAISDSIKAQMKEQMAKSEDITYFYESEFPEMDFKEIPENANFYIDEDGVLTLVFDKYEVAPGYMGSVEFKIPAEVLAGMVKDGYLN